MAKRKWRSFGRWDANGLVRLATCAFIESFKDGRDCATMSSEKCVLKAFKQWRPIRENCFLCKAKKNFIWPTSHCISDMLNGGYPSYLLHHTNTRTYMRASEYQHLYNTNMTDQHRIVVKLKVIIWNRWLQKYDYAKRNNVLDFVLKIKLFWFLLFKMNENIRFSLPIFDVV